MLSTSASDVTSGGPKSFFSNGLSRQDHAFKRQLFIGPVAAAAAADGSFDWCGVVV
jgi:hypothetical protein